MRTVLSKLTAIILFLLSSLSTTANTDPFSFTALTNAQLNTSITSNVATISGFDSTISIRIEGGSYTIGASVPTAAEGTITAGATVAVQVLSSGEFNTQTVATLTVGSGASATRAIFSVTTRPDPARTPNSINLTLSAPTTTADNPITITLSASDASGAIDIAKLMATVVLAGATISTSGNEITYTPSAAGSETISIISINGIDVSGVSSSATFDVFHGAIARIGLEPQNPTFLVDGTGSKGVTIAVTLYDANNNLVLVRTLVLVDGEIFDISIGFTSGGIATARIGAEDKQTGIVTFSAGGISTTTTVTAAEVANIGFGIGNTISVNSPITITISATDSAGGTIDINTLAATITIPSAAISINGNQITYTPSVVGMETISITSINGIDVSGVSSSSFIFNVANPPVFTSTPTIIATPFNLYRYDLSASSVGSSDFVFSAAPGTQLPNWLGIGSVVTTLAGRAGDNDGVTSTAGFRFPADVAIDADGNIIVADRSNHRIRKISPEGIVSTVAGSSMGFNNGASATAKFSSPSGVAIDADSNIIVADRNNQRIRNIAPNGMVTTIAGDGITGSTDGASATARFRFPTGVAIDADGNIIVADRNNDRIRKISPSGMVSTIAGSSRGFTNGASETAKFNFLTNVAIDADGDIIVADRNNHRIRNIAPNGIVSTIAGSGQGFGDGASATAKFNSPRGVAVDAVGNIIVADTINNRIRSISTDGTVRTVAGGAAGRNNGAASIARFSSPVGIAIDAAGNIIFADSVNHRIRKIDTNSLALAGTPDCGDIGNYNLELIVSDGELQGLQSFSLVVRDDGRCGAAPTNLALSTTTVDANTLANSVIATISADDNDNPASLSFSIIGGEDSASFSINAGNQLVIDHNPDHTVQGSYEIIISASDTVHITTKSFRINVFHIDRVPVFTSTPVITARVNSPYQYKLGASDADSSNLEFSVVPGTVLPDWLAIGVFVTTVAGDGLEGNDDGNSATASFNKPRDVAIDSSGNIIVADTFNNRIRSIATDGTVRTIAGSSSGFGDGASATAQFRTPSGVVIDASGNIIVADSNNNRIRSIAADGTVTTLAGEGPFGSNDGASATARFGSPWGIAIDANANIIVSDSFAHRIRSISPNGMVSTVAGSSAGSTNGASATAQFLFPVGVAIDANGNIIVGDSNNNRIRGISTDGTVTTIAGGSSGSTNGASATAQFSAPTGVVIDASGNIIVADQNNHRIRNIAPDGTVSTIAGSSRGFADGVVSDAQFIHPTGFAIDASGNIIIADQDNHRIRKIDRNNYLLGASPGCADVGIYSLELIVSDGIFQGSQSFDISLTSDGSCGIIPTNLALSVSTIIEGIAANSVIATISATASNALGPFEFSIVGGRDSASFSISDVNKLVIDHSPSVANQSSYEVIISVSDSLHTATKSFEIGVVGTESVPVFISNPITRTRVNSPYQYNLRASDAEGDNLMFSAAPDVGLPSWLVIDTIVSTLAGEGSAGSDDGVTSTASFNSVDGIAIDASGNIIVADGNNHRIRKISPEGIVSTIAGGGRIGVLGGDFADGASATARFSSPRNVAIDASGNIIVADGNNRRIRSISPEGIVSTIAGSGSRDFADGASATAKFDFPSGIAIDASGNIIITDGGNNRIRSISSDGTVTTIAGSGDDGFADGASATAKFDFPTGIAIDASGNIIVADFSNHRIRSISTDGTVTTIAGSGGGFVDGASATAKFSLPRDVAIDASGNIIVVDSNNHSIRNISPEGIVSTIAGNGQAGGNDGPSSQDKFSFPSNVAIDASGNIIITSGNRIRKINRNSFTVAGIAGCDDIGVHSLALIVSDGELQSSQSFDIAVVDDISCDVAPTDLRLSVTTIVEGIAANSVIATISATASNALGPFEFSIVDGRDSASFSIINDNQLVIDHSPSVETQSNYEIIIGVSDNLHLATKSFKIMVVGIESVPVFTSEPITAIKVNSPYQYSLRASDAEGGRFVFDAASGTVLPSWLDINTDIVVTTIAGSSRGFANGASATAKFFEPRGVVIDALGNIIVADRDNNRIRSISTEGTVTTIAGGSAGFVDGASATAKFRRPQGVAIDTSGNIIVADEENHRIRKIAPNGMVTTIAGGGSTGSFGGAFADGASATARFSFPADVAIDAAGNIIVADHGNNRIRGISTDGIVFTIAGRFNGFADGIRDEASFDFPRGVDIDAAGNIIVTDSSNSSIRSISPEGRVRTIAGREDRGLVNGIGTAARFTLPDRAAIDSFGNIIVADALNHRIRNVATNRAVTTIAGSGPIGLTASNFADGAGTTARFNEPRGVAIDASGNIIIADALNDRIRKIDRTKVMLAGTPSCDDIDIHSLELMVSDSMLTNSQSFNVIVADDGSCDAAPTNLALSTITVVEDILANSVIATISADDNDNPESLSFSVVGGRDGASFSVSATNQLVIDHSPDFNTQKIYEIIISASDTIHTATKNFEISVISIAGVPIFISNPVTSTRVSSPYRYSLDIIDINSTGLVLSPATGTTLPDWLTIDIIVTTLAGDGVEDGDDGATNTASFNFPAAAVIDDSGNIIISDSFNHRIRSIGLDGVVRTIAGGGGLGLAGGDFVDGASATARFNFPTAVAIDASGSIIVADRDNNRIRSISMEGTVTTIAGGSPSFVDGSSTIARFSSPSDIAIDALGNIIVADTDNHRIRSISTGGIVSTIAGSDFGFADGASATAMFFQPRGVAIDALGNILVADSSSHRVRSISSDGTVTTIAGAPTGSITGDFMDGATSTARFNNPFGIAVDSRGNIIIADSDNHRIRSISTDGIVRTIAGGSEDFADGIGAVARFNFPTGVVIDSRGNIIVADNLNHRMRKIDRTNFVLVGTPSCSDVGVNDIALMISDGEFESLQNFDITVADDGSCDVAPTNLTLSTTNIVENIAADSVIATINATTTNALSPFEFSIVGGRDSASFSITSGNQLVIDHSPDFESQNSYEIIISVSDIIHQLTKTFNISVDDINEVTPVFTSNPITTIRVNNPYQYNPSASSTDEAEFVFSTATGTTLPDWLITDVIVTTVAGDGMGNNDDGATNTASFSAPVGVVIDALGNIIVTDQNNHRIRSIGLDGMVRTVAGSGPTNTFAGSFADGAGAVARFHLPIGVAIDASGNIIVADQNNHRIRSIDPDGMVRTIAGSGPTSTFMGSFADGTATTVARFNAPIGVAVDADGNIIVADRLNHRIRNISPNNIVTTIAGSEKGSTNGASATARFNSPTDVAIDLLGNIIVVDRDNHRIRSISAEGTVTTIAGGSEGFADGVGTAAEFNNPYNVAIDLLGNIIVSDRDNHRIRSIDTGRVVSTIAGGDAGFADGVGATAQFEFPRGVAIDALGNIIVADISNNRIRKIDRNSFTVAGVAGCGDIGVHNLAIIVSDRGIQNVQSFDISVLDNGSCGVIPASIMLSTTNVVENIAPDSVIASISATATNALSSFGFSIVGGRDSASFSIINNNQLVIDHSPDFETQNNYEIIIGASDNLHIATKSFEISVIGIERVPVFTSTPIITAMVRNPYQYSLSASDTDSSDLVFGIAAEAGLPSWLALSPIVTTLAGDGSQGSNNGATSTASFELPANVVIDASGNIIVADKNNHLIRSISPEGVVSTVAGSDTGFADGASNTAMFNSPTGVAIDSSGNIIIADTFNQRIRKIAQNGMVSTIAGTGSVNFADGASATARFNFPGDITIDNSANIIVADTFNHRIRNIDTNTMVTTIAGSVSVDDILLERAFADGASNTAKFNTPMGVVVDLLGNIIVADSFNHRIRSINADAMVTTIAGTGSIGLDNGSFADGVSNTARFNAPTGVAIDALGNIIVADRDNNRIRSISPEGVVTTIAGSSTGFADGAGVVAEFNAPTGITVDAFGNIIVADRDNHRIRKINRNSIALAGIPPECNDIGSYDVALIVSDGEFQSSQSFTINVVGDGSCLVVPFSFDAIADVVPNATISSAAITVAVNAQGSQSTFTISIEGSDARYSINGGSYTDSSGVVSIGDSVRVQIVASNQAITTKIATISIDNIAAAFAVTTADFMIAGGDRSANYNSPAITITTTITDSQVVWSSSATNIISFSDPNSGLVTIVGAGSALIRASRAGAEDSIVFTIMPLTLTPTFASPQSFIYNTSIITALVTITSGIVATDDVSLSISGATATNVGNYNIDLTLIGTDSRNYFLSTTTFSWSIIKANQSQFSLNADTTITFGSSFSSPATGVSATVATSYGSSDHNVATIAPNGDITIIGIGSTIISATNTGDNNYNSAAASYQLTITQATQDPFSITASDSLIFGATTTIVVVESGSGDGVVSYNSSNIAVIAITTGGAITATGVGEATITATKAGGANYLDISDTHFITVRRASQTSLIISGNSTLANAATGFASATGGSGTGAISFSSSNPDIATITQDGVITAKSLGTTTISATKSGGDNYHDTGDNYLLTIVNTTPTVANSIANQIISLRNLFNFIIPANTFNDPNGDTLTISVSNLPDGLMFDSANTIITGTPTAIGISTITITADDGNGAMASTSFSLSVSDDFIIIGNNPRTIIYGVASQNIEAQGGVSPDGAVTFASSTPSVANFGDTNIGELTISSAGTTIITATREGSGEQASISIIISPRTIIPTFASSQTFIYNTNIRTVLITITSGIVAGDDVSLAITGATATDVGNYNINLGLIGSNSLSYRLSTTTLSWSIIKADQVLIYPSNTISINYKPNNATATSQDLTGAQTTISYTTSPTTSDVTTIDDSGIITILNAGSVVIIASATETNNYNSGAASYLLTIHPIDQTGFMMVVSNILEVGATTTATASGGQSSSAVSFSSSNPAVATINQDGLINTQSLGTTTIIATKRGGRNYNDISDGVLLEVVIRFNLDIDGDGSRLTTTDGILIIRFLTGSTNTINTADATTTEAQRDNQQILKFLQRGYDRLDIDGNGTIAASSDGMLIMRYLADQENLNTIGIPTSVGVATITFNLQNIYQ